MVDDLKEYANVEITDEILSRGSQYTHGRPTSKEALLYRQIFESFYPGQSKTVPSFGCLINHGRTVMY